jgi:hypothetical protein
MTYYDWEITHFEVMSHVSQQAGILIHQRDSRVSSLSEFEEFWQSSRTRLNQSLENSIEPEWILAELPCSSYSEDSRKVEKSSGPQNLTSLSTLQRLNLEAPFFTLSAGGSTVLFIGVRQCSGQRLGMWHPLVRPAGHATWPPKVSSLHHLWALDTLSTTSSRHVDKMDFGNAPTHGRPAKVIWPAGHTLAQLRPCHIISLCHIFCDYALFWI